MPDEDVKEAREKAQSIPREDVITARKAQWEKREFPGGQQRTKPFPGTMQARLVEKDGRQFYHVDGFATVFERGYDMWDMFGPYKEILDARSLDKSLNANPDVAFLVNHRGITMARTTNGTLALSKKTNDEGYRGLHSDAYLNPDRQDVRDFVSAVVDKLVTEMSFAFILNDGVWNDDFTEFRIMEADINRGDVSGVNYGANPFTSIVARTAEILDEIEHLPLVAMPEVMKRAATKMRKEYRDAAATLIEDAVGRYTRAAEDLHDQEQPESTPEPVVEYRTGKPAKLWKIRLENFT